MYSVRAPTDASQAPSALRVIVGLVIWLPLLVVLVFFSAYRLRSALSKALTSRRCALAAFVWRPWMIGLPVDLPPCILQRPFFIAYPRQGFPVVLQRAPQRG